MIRHLLTAALTGAAAFAAPLATASDQVHGAVFALQDRRAALLDGLAAAAARPPFVPNLAAEGSVIQLMGQLRTFDAFQQAEVERQRATLQRVLDPFDNIYAASADGGLAPAQSRAIGDAMNEVFVGFGSPDNGPNPVNDAIFAGFTFLGQFIDHDMTRAEFRILERVEELQVASLEAVDLSGQARRIVENLRSSALDLDSVYALGAAEFTALLADVGDRPLCGPSAAARCFNAAGRAASERNALALLELDADARPTGRLRLVERRMAPDDGRVSLDLPRCGDGPRLAAAPICAAAPDGTPAPAARAVIGDGRNDENLIIARIHTLFIEAHNRLIDEELATLDRADAASAAGRQAAFRVARARLTRHWQAIVLDDYLVETVGGDLAEAVRTGPLRFYTRGDGAPFCTTTPGTMPHEFAVAAFRFGHSQVRGGYLLRSDALSGLGFAALFGEKVITPDLSVELALFFELDAAGAPQLSQAIDTILSNPLSELRTPSIDDADVDDPIRGALAQRNLERVAIEPVEATPPSQRPALERIPVIRGLDAAARLAAAGVALTPITDAEMAALLMTRVLAPETFPDGLKAADLPLWVYVLAEAELRHGGARLGAVGGHIVGETIAGLIRCDANGVLAVADWTPSMLPAAGLRQAGRYTMADLVNFVAAPAAAE